ncbi:hypothetical protein [Paenirhodobacter sp.]
MSKTLIVAAMVAVLGVAACAKKEPPAPAPEPVTVEPTTGKYK